MNDDARVMELLKRLRQWDMLDACADGPYWKGEIDKVLNAPCVERSQADTEALASGIRSILMEHRLTHTLADDESGGHPLVDALTAPFDDTINSGQEEIDLLADEIALGLGSAFAVQRTQPESDYICMDCDGCGWCEGSPAWTCKTCNGTGRVPNSFGLCEGCPGIEYTDATTRCTQCPRRPRANAPSAVQQQEGK